MADADGVIDRDAFFDALRKFFATTNAFETHIYPDRVVVRRFVRGDDGRRLVINDAGLLLHTDETYWLRDFGPVDNSGD